MKRTPVEIRILRKGESARRQAQFRLSPADAWHDMLVTAADKALRNGSMKVGEVEFPVFVSRETSHAPVFPHAKAFSEQAIRLNDTINSMYAAAGGRA